MLIAFLRQVLAIARVAALAFKLACSDPYRAQRLVLAAQPVPQRHRPPSTGSDLGGRSGAVAGDAQTGTDRINHHRVIARFGPQRATRPRSFLAGFVAHPDLYRADTYSAGAPTSRLSGDSGSNPAAPLRSWAVQFFRAGGAWHCVGDIRRNHLFTS